MITKQGLAFIKRWEGMVLHVYRDAVGLPTIGVGHLIKKGESFTTITEQEAEELLQRDLRVYEKAVNNLITVPLTSNQFDALVSFTFNVGCYALQRSTLRSRLNREEYKDAADAFLKWVWGGTPRRKIKGLIRRREAERILFLTP